MMIIIYEKTRHKILNYIYDTYLLLIISGQSYLLLEKI